MDFDFFFILERDVAPWYNVRLWCDRSLDRSLMVDKLIYFCFQPVLHNWCNKGRGMRYTVYGMLHINTF